MKNSYKPIGTLWDHLPETDIGFNLVPYDLTYSPIGQPDCLFDDNGKRRSITLTKLLAINNRNGIEVLRRHCTDCSSIAVIVDYIPTSTGRIQQDFYRHRVRQAIYTLRHIAPDAEVTLMTPLVLEAAA